MGEITQRGAVPALSVQDAGTRLLSVASLVALPAASHAAGGTGGFLEGLRTPRCPRTAPRREPAASPSASSPACSQPGARTCPVGLWMGDCHLGSFTRRWATNLAVSRFGCSPGLSLLAPGSLCWPKQEEMGELPWESGGGARAGPEGLSPSPAPHLEQGLAFPLSRSPFPALLGVKLFS